jgi:hypothetical protein
MSVDIELIANLEWINYAASQAIIDRTPDLALTMRNDLILTSSQSFPAPDTTHACLLRATPQLAKALLDEVTDYFQSRNLPPTVYLSPACAPTDLPDRLESRGFERQPGEEAWLMLEGVADVLIPPAMPGFRVQAVTAEDVLAFARVFLTAFGMPSEFAPYLADLLAPSVDVPGVYHYLAWAGDEPVGTCSLICYQDYGILGSVGVLPAFRQSGAATNLAIAAGNQAKTSGVNTAILQTTADTFLEQVLRMYGFRRVFTRICYTLS